MICATHTEPRIQERPAMWLRPYLEKKEFRNIEDNFIFIDAKRKERLFKKHVTCISKKKKRGKLVSKGIHY